MTKGLLIGVHRIIGVIRLQGLTIESQMDLLRRSNTIFLFFMLLKSFVLAAVGVNTLQDKKSCACYFNQQLPPSRFL